MNINPFCMCCLINKQEQKIRKFSDNEKKCKYMKKILRLISEAGKDDCTCSLAVDIQKIYEDFWNVQEDFSHIKHDFNQLMLGLEKNLEQAVRNSPDPLATSLLYARIGNYIDFAALSHVDKETVLSMIESENKDPLDPEEYQHFLSDLEKASSFVYLTDNCGEIVLDKIAIKILKEHYPNLNITAIVRGKPVVNDATIEDAKETGLDQIVPVVGNGTDIGGTWIPRISSEARTLLENADVILAKGQGNFETLHENGLNVYYLFLCKCEWFSSHFNARHLQGMFLNEKRI